MMRINLLVALVIAAVGTVPRAHAQDTQEPVSVQKLYEAGKYDEVVSRVSEPGDRPQDLIYLAGQSQLKLEQRDAARETFSKLAAGDEEGPWSAVGRSAAAMAEGNLDVALEAANQAVERAPDLFYAHYQKGLVESQRGNFASAASELERALEIDGGFAYAHYYAGMAYYKTKRLDRMSQHFQSFVRLAPEAPERPGVDAILRTLTGRR